MPAVLPEASIVRAPSHSHGAVRAPAGADQPVSPFSELLASSEAPNAPASEPANAAEPARAEAVRDGKTAQPVDADKAAPKNFDGKPAKTAEAEDVPADIAVIPAMIAAPEELPIATALTVALAKAAVPEEGQSETSPVPGEESPSDPVDVSAVAELVPVPVILPAPIVVAVAVAVAIPVPVATVEADPAAIQIVAPAAIANETSVGIAPAVEAPLPEAIAVAAKLTQPATASDAKLPAPASEEGHAGARTALADEADAPSLVAKIASPEQTEQSAKPAKTAAEAPIHKVTNVPGEAASAARRDSNMPDSKPASTTTVATAAPAPDAAGNQSPLLTQPGITASAAPQATQAAGPQPNTSVAVPVAGLAVEIAAHAQGGKNRFEIRLDPPELGRIDVRLEIDGDGRVTSHLRVERPETLDLLRRDAPALERALQQAGLKTSDNGLQFSLRDQAFSQRDQARDTPAMARIVVPDDTLVAVETQRNYGRLAGLGGGVDIRV